MPPSANRQRQSDFYPRPPRGGRQGFTPVPHQSGLFLSTPSARRATWTATLRRSFTKFLSTPSARRATLFTTTKASLITISIHALREEGDSGCRFCSCRTFYFYPRPPRGGRHAHISIPAPFAQFLSTPSARRATYKRTELEPSMDISIHALREEGDSRRKRSKSNLKYFYPRPPRGGRPTPARQRAGG